MIAVDTNVLVRLLINDPDSQTQVSLAKALLKRAKQVYVPQIVQIEMVWVLETAYGFDKSAVITVLKHLQQTLLFVLQDEASLILHWRFLKITLRIFLITLFCQAAWKIIMSYLPLIRNLHAWNR